MGLRHQSRKKASASQSRRSGPQKPQHYAAFVANTQASFEQYHELLQCVSKSSIIRLNAASSRDLEAKPLASTTKSSTCGHTPLMYVQKCKQLEVKPRKAWLAQPHQLYRLVEAEYRELKWYFSRLRSEKEHRS
jgi:hypothetical protein